jgi:hypothetical protein
MRALALLLLATYVGELFKRRGVLYWATSRALHNSHKAYATLPQPGCVRYLGSADRIGYKNPKMNALLGVDTSLLLRRPELHTHNPEMTPALELSSEQS